ncbi:hypothetical protein BOVATA_012990 [Babesia ovata]|uniref:Uncharacterized protein n=1 Tax=Babesia ovata TaxID=189622 RepID=A0A2H6K9Z0_9APIC|nr:uncharacterized protein BOVATA_012990 [Babesia ovata]GBE59806.1 hypothetical protein BOVATA_012990 [Babesia ovata]
MVFMLSNPEAFLLSAAFCAAPAPAWLEVCEDEFSSFKGFRGGIIMFIGGILALGSFANSGKPSIIMGGKNTIGIGGISSPFMPPVPGAYGIGGIRLPSMEAEPDCIMPIGIIPSIIQPDKGGTFGPPIVELLSPWPSNPGMPGIAPGGNGKKLGMPGIPIIPGGICPGIICSDIVDSPDDTTDADFALGAALAEDAADPSDLGPAPPGIGGKRQGKRWFSDPGAALCAASGRRKGSPCTPGTGKPSPIGPCGAA